MIEEILIEERQLILTHEKDTDRQHTLLTTAILIAAQSKLLSSSAPLALVRLLQAVKPAQRSRVSDIILDSPDADACLQALRQLQTEV